MSKVLTLFITVDDETNAHDLASELHALVQYDQERSGGDQVSEVEGEEPDDAISHVVSIDAEPVPLASGLAPGGEDDAILTAEEAMEGPDRTEDANPNYYRAKITEPGGDA